MMVNGQQKFEALLEDIRTVKIQGAENIAKAGIQAYLLQQGKKSAEKILKTRPTEPLLQHSIKRLLTSKKPEQEAKKILNEIKRSHETLARIGTKLIKNDMNVYTHCHSSSVIDILRQAKKKKKKFVVYTTEVEPLLQGRMTAHDLAKEGIHVIVGPDLAMEQLVSKCDIVLFGADAYTNTFVVNKIGTSTLCDLAKHHHIPRFACGVSTKYTKKVLLEQRNGKEVWDKHDKGISIENPAFDKVNYDLVSGIISEEGIMKPKEFVKKAKSTNKD